MRRMATWLAIAAGILCTMPEATAQENAGWDPTNGVPAPSELTPENLPNLEGPPTGGTGASKPAGEGSSNGSSEGGSSALFKVSWKELKEYEGKVGDKNWAALYKAFAKGWDSEKDEEYAAEHRNRYDLVLFGKKFQKIAGHRTKVEKLKKGKPVTTFNIEFLTNGLKLDGTYSQSYTLVSFTGQFWISAVPIMIKASSAVSFGCVGNTVLGKPFSAYAAADAAISVALTAAVGFKWGYVGVEGMMNIVEAGISLDVLHDGENFKVKSAFVIGSSGKVSVVAKIAFVSKKYPIWESPQKKWFEKVLLDKTF